MVAVIISLIASYTVFAYLMEASLNGDLLWIFKKGSWLDLLRNPVAMAPLVLLVCCLVFTITYSLLQ